MRIKFEKSKNNRASCRICKKTIIKGDLRAGTPGSMSIPGRHSYDGGPAISIMEWYHVDCLASSHLGSSKGGSFTLVKELAGGFACAGCGGILQVNDTCMERPKMVETSNGKIISTMMRYHFACGRKVKTGRRTDWSVKYAPYEKTCKHCKKTVAEGELCVDNQDLDGYHADCARKAKIKLYSASGIEKISPEDITFLKEARIINTEPADSLKASLLSFLQQAGNLETSHFENRLELLAELEPEEKEIEPIKPLLLSLVIGDSEEKVKKATKRLLKDMNNH